LSSSRGGEVRGTKARRNESGKARHQSAVEVALLARQLDAEQRQHEPHHDDRRRGADDQPRVPALAEVRPAHPSPEDEPAGRRGPPPSRLRVIPETNYSSGEDYEIEFLGYRFAFNAFDFEQRVTAAAVKLGLLQGNELDDEETADLVELVHRGLIDEPRSALGRYVVRHWERVSLVDGESLVYWLRKLVFLGAWLDHRVKEGLLDVTWDDENADLGYSD